MVNSQLSKVMYQFLPFRVMLAFEVWILPRHHPTTSAVLKRRFFRIHSASKSVVCSDPNLKAAVQSSSGVCGSVDGSASVNSSVV